MSHRMEHNYVYDTCDYLLSTTLCCERWQVLDSKYIAVPSEKLKISVRFGCTV